VRKQRISKKNMTHRKILHYVKLLEHNNFYSILHSENANWSHIVCTNNSDLWNNWMSKILCKVCTFKKNFFNERNILFNFQLYYRFLSENFRVKRIHDLTN